MVMFCICVRKNWICNYVMFIRLKTIICLTQRELVLKAQNKRIFSTSFCENLIVRFVTIYHITRYFVRILIANQFFVKSVTFIIFNLTKCVQTVSKNPNSIRKIKKMN